MRTCLHPRDHTVEHVREAFWSSWDVRRALKDGALWANAWWPGIFHVWFSVNKLGASLHKGFVGAQNKRWYIGPLGLCFLLLLGCWQRKYEIGFRHHHLPFLPSFVCVCVCALSLHNCELLVGLINAELSVNVRTPLWISSREEADRWARPFIHLSFIHLSIHSLLTPVLELHHYICNIGASLVAQLVKNLSAVQETWVRSLGWGDPLEKEMETYSSIFAWKISWTEETGGLQSMRSQRVGHDWVANTNTKPIF